jgi:hypothetical protein
VERVEEAERLLVERVAADCRGHGTRGAVAGPSSRRRGR